MSATLKSAASLLVLALLASQAAAATVTLGGDHFTVSYDTAVVGLFGNPSLVDSSLVFAPGGAPGFSAQTASGLDFTNSTFSFSIIADPGYQITGFNLFEAGDYFLIGNGSRVSVGGQLRVKPLGSSAVTGSIAPSGPMTTHTDFPSFATSNWEAVASVVPVAPLGSAVVSIENILGAFAPPGQNGYAFIEKKNVELGLVVTPVPETAPYAMMLAGLGLIGFVARRGVKAS